MDFLDFMLYGQTFHSVSSDIKRESVTGSSGPLIYSQYKHLDRRSRSLMHTVHYHFQRSPSVWVLLYIMFPGRWVCLRVLPDQTILVLFNYSGRHIGYDHLHVQLVHHRHLRNKNNLQTYKRKETLNMMSRAILWTRQSDLNTNNI